MKIFWRLMYEVIVDLTSMASLSIGDGIRDHLRPIVSKSSKPVSDLRSELVSSTHTAVSFPECPCAFCMKDSGVKFHHTIGDIIFT